MNITHAFRTFNYPFTFVVVFLIFCSHNVFSQNLADNWYFGNGAGLEFVPDATAVSKPIDAGEACASVSDDEGNLLFYTNGLEIYDATNNPMPNGSDLSGELSSTQALIVQNPDSCDIYYVLYMGSHLSPNGGVWYSKVDMNLNDGKGDIVTGYKNINLLETSSEGITASLHNNNNDCWVITHDMDNSFYVYPVTGAGVGSPVITEIGVTVDASLVIGTIKANHAGDKFVKTCTFDEPDLGLYDFNRSTGVVTGFTSLTDKFPFNSAFYGIEFSPNDNLLYVTDVYSDCFLYQYEFSTEILTTLENTDFASYDFGQLQLAPDGKIYVARFAQEYISSIEFPDVPGVACNYVAMAVALAADTESQLGMTNFPPFYFNTSFLNQHSCSQQIAIEENTSAAKFIIYPNPTSGIIRFDDFQPEELNALISIYNNSSQLMQRVEFTQEMNVEFLPAGIYYLRIEDHVFTVIKE